MNSSRQMSGTFAPTRRAFIGQGAFALLLALAACLPAGARSITDVRHVAAHGHSSLVVTFEPGAPGDAHALYAATRERHVAPAGGKRFTREVPFGGIALFTRE